MVKHKYNKSATIVDDDDYDNDDDDDDDDIKSFKSKTFKKNNVYCIKSVLMF